MPEIVFSLVFMLCIGGYIVSMKKRVDRHFESHTTIWTDTLLSFVEKNGLSDIDIEFKSISDIKKKSNTKESIIFVGKEIPKGYDFIDSTFEVGYYFGPHKHEYSSEFIYIIDGEMEITLCRNTPDFCDGCENGCSLYEKNKTEELVEIKTLKSGDFIYVDSGKYHTIKVLKKLRCISVALPPMSRGIL